MKIENLKKMTGTYSGEGLNHEEQKFQGDLNLNYSNELKAFRIIFKASGANGELFHFEESTLAQNIMQRWTLWNLNSNTPGLTPHELTHEAETPEGYVLTFTFGDRAQTNSFRETVTLSLHNDKSLEYTYSWGMPGGEFKKRSSVRMLKN